MRSSRLAALASASALAFTGLGLAACDTPAPQCDFYVHWAQYQIANGTAACIGGTPTWGVPGFALGFQVAFTNATRLLTNPTWQAWGTPDWYNPGTAVYFSRDAYLQCVPHQTLWYRPVLGTSILNGVPEHVSSYGDPVRITCGDGVWSGPVQKSPNTVVGTTKLFPRPKM